MKDIVVTVRCSTEWIGALDKISTQKEVNEAVKEAVEEALTHGENRGFNHRLSDDMCIVVTNVDAWALGDKE